MYLEDEASGYFCTSFDLGYPTVRAVVNNRPDQHGADDLTQFWGERAISVAITAVASAGSQIDALTGKFARFMDVSARPVLHWIFDRPGATERTLTLRPANMTFPIVGNTQRDLHMQWVAPDPLPRDPNIQTVTAWAGSSSATGRAYSRTYPRTYPPPGGPTATIGHIVSNGDFPVSPLLRIYGPITAPVVTIVNSDGSGTSSIKFSASTVVNSGHFIDVDTNRKTAYFDADHTQPAISSLDWTASSWPVVNPAPNQGNMTLSGGSTTGITQVLASWQDVFLT
jgi:hypothetical protein